MCGIVGYVGASAAGDGPADPSTDAAGDALEVLMNGLSNLEYRGYDSAGVALATGTIDVVKREGELENLREAVAADGADARIESADATTGIGHTRWSTHGAPSDENAHPHTGCTDDVAVVHNGIVENYDALRAELEAAGHEFESETDTEVVPHLIEHYCERGDDDEAAFRAAIDRLEGSYAVAAVLAGSDALYAARRGSPLVIGFGRDATFLASDVPAFVEYTDRVAFLEDGEIARIEGTDVTIVDADGREADPEITTVDWDPEDAAKSGYDHYMLKEIHEQPRGLRQCLRGRVDEFGGGVDASELFDGCADAALHDAVPESVHLVACGTSYHAALYGARVLRTRGVPAQPFLASEYDPSAIPVSDGTLVVGVTQSGETADTLRALRTARGANADTLAVTNTVGSTAARECDDALYVRAGPEIGVAATKTFASQLAALNLLAPAVADGSAPREHVAALRDLPDQVRRILDETRADEIAKEYVGADAYFFVGRGYNRPVALEGALKMKEITYKHAEGFAAGELKHGPLALIDDATPVFALVTGDGETAQKTVSNVKEVQARGAPVVAVTDGRTDVASHADAVLRVPETRDRLAPLLANVQLQLVSYHTARRLGRSIDKPRHLAKSVTVE